MMMMINDRRQELLHLHDLLHWYHAQEKSRRLYARQLFSVVSASQIQSGAFQKHCSSQHRLLSWFCDVTNLPESFETV